MNLKIKYSVRIALITVALLLSSYTSSAQCDYNGARNYYYSGYYQQALGAVYPCLNSAPQYVASNPTYVFQIYKCAIESNYELGNDYRAEELENQLYSLFSSTYSAGEIDSIYDSTSI